jgi:hypothetical protein
MSKVSAQTKITLSKFGKGARKDVRKATDAVLAAALCAASFTLAAIAGPKIAGATPATLYAYSAGGTTSPSSCSLTTMVASQCTFAESLTLAAAGDTVALMSSQYLGNFVLSTTGTSSGSQVTIAPGFGVSEPVLNGSGSGSDLRIGAGVFATISGIAFTGGSASVGGGINAGSGADVTVENCKFSQDVSTMGLVVQLASEPRADRRAR